MLYNLENSLVDDNDVCNNMISTIRLLVRKTYKRDDNGPILPTEIHTSEGTSTEIHTSETHSNP